MSLTKKTYLQGFLVAVVILACLRWAFPEIAAPTSPSEPETAADSLQTAALADAKPAEKPAAKPVEKPAAKPAAKGKKPHRILSVPSYTATFPDTNAVQLVAAQKWGVTPVKNREDAESRKRELVYIGSNPYYHVDPLYSSIPYLVPRAAVLLQDIGQAFFDSLYVKGVPFHKLIVTSVLRSQDDVVKLRRRNGNATENSCHLYGTTFDICYNRYQTVQDPAGPRRRMVRNDTLKWVLSEVLRDMREQQRCYIKYEVKQGCFHMTVR